MTTQPMNPLEVYAECGRKAGIARNQSDESLAQFQANWLRRALALESKEWATMARKAYDDAYKAARTNCIDPMTLYRFGRY